MPAGQTGRGQRIGAIGLVACATIALIALAGLGDANARAGVPALGAQKSKAKANPQAKAPAKPAEGDASEKQDEAADADAKVDAKAQPKGGQRLPGGVPPRNRRAAADPLAPRAAAAAGAGAVAAAPAAANRVPVWPYHYTLKYASLDGTALHAAYYPAQQAFRAPVALLIHETGQAHSGKDFEESLDELKGKSFARYLQDEGYAVLAVDLRGHGANARRELTRADWPILVGDLQAAYRFLIDRHNRGELNLAKLAVIGLGDGANLALAWAASPGGGVSTEGRLGDIAALVLISPVAEIPGMALARVVPELAARIPMLVASGDEDQASVGPVRAGQQVFERNRLSRVVFYDTTLHAAKLLSFFPKAASSIPAFLEDPVATRAVDWEPRYLLDPIQYGEVTLVPDSGFEEPANVNANPNAPPRQAPQPRDPARNR